MESHLKLHQQGEVVRGDVGMGAAQYLVLSKPFLIVWTQQFKHLQSVLGVKDVVNDAFEVVPVKQKDHMHCNMH